MGRTLHGNCKGELMFLNNSITADVFLHCFTFKLFLISLFTVSRIGLRINPISLLVGSQTSKIHVRETPISR